MRERVRAALVIARRDYVASVFSRTFLLFLIGPLFPILFGLIFGAVGAQIERAPVHPTVAVIASADDGQALLAARARIASRLQGGGPPDLTVVAPEGDTAAQTSRLLKDTSGRYVAVLAVLASGLDRPLLTGPQGAIGAMAGPIGLVLDQARATRAKGAALPAPVEVKQAIVSESKGSDRSDRVTIARVGQLVLLMLTMILAGMLLSNLLEEKSSKVIEILAAAVPVDAIFLGKLTGMLAMSLTGIAVWGAIALGGAAAMLPAGSLGSLTPPAVGWPGFVALGIAYFIASYLLLGAVFLGIGGQAASVREVQTLSMPVTMGQLVVFAFSSTAVADPLGPLAKAAMIFPWSSPLAMFAFAAQEGAIWPHLLAIGWQALWVALIIRVGARMFRRSVLKSGASGRRRWWRRSKA